MLCSKKLILRLRISVERIKLSSDVQLCFFPYSSVVKILTIKTNKEKKRNHVFAINVRHPSSSSFAPSQYRDLQNFSKFFDF